ncbi:hypothetical protein FRB99_007101 [Tulasnella sp. 403]|nr:hypothetical protein FRB99_007101 [Tulasnella sp. 403]
MNFYREAARVIDQLDAKRGSIKGCLASIDERNRKRTAALVIETLKYRPSLNQVIDLSGLLSREKRHLGRNLALVLVHDLLLTKKGIEVPDGPIKQAVLRHKTRLQGEWVKLKVKRGATSNDAMVEPSNPGASHPRFVRVNTNKWTLEAALSYFLERGYTKCETYSEEGKTFALDAHVPNLLVFPSNTSFETDPAYADGRLILQDKASCFPALVLAPPPGSVVIDATSAPGNKTTHLSALMNGTGRIIAFERDRRRFDTLQTMVTKAGCKNVQTRHADFLRIEPSDPQFQDVTHILLDPSCSGSGIVNRLDYLLEAGK